MGALSTAYGYSKDLNRSLTDIRIVSGQSAEEMKEFAEQANKAAKALNATTVDYTDAALIYYQQGLDQDAVEERTNATIKMANVTGETAKTVSDQMTAIWNNYDDGSKKLEYYADVITALGAATASSSGEIAQGLEKFSAIAGQVGLSYEYATSALATVTATTRESADVVGTAFKTLFARIQGLNLGETLEDGVTLNKYSEALSKVGISIFEQNGELKAMDKILDEMGSKWETLSNAQRVALAQTVAGVRQYNQLMTLMGNWDFFKENLAVAQGSEGELQRQADIYAESWEAARDRVRASAEDIYDSIINEEAFISLDNVLTPVLSTIADLIDGMGGLGGAVTIAAFAFTRLYGDKISAGLVKTADNIRILTGSAQESARTLQDRIASEAENLQISSIANKQEQTRLQLMRDEVTLQGKINQLESVMTDEDRERIKYQQDILNLFKQQYAELSKQQTAEEFKILETETNDILTASPDDEDNWQKNIQEKINAWNNDKSEDKQIKIDINTQEPSKHIEQISKKLKTYTSESAELLRLRFEWSKLSEEQQQNKQTLIDLIKSTDNLKKKFKDLDSASLAQLQQWFESLSSEAVEVNQKIEVLKKVLKELGVDDSAIKEYIDDLRKLATTTDKCRMAGEAYDQTLDKTHNSLDTVGKKTLDWSRKLVLTADVLGQVSMGIQSIQTLGNIFTEEDLSMTERLTQGLMALSMLLPLLSSGMAAYSTILKTTKLTLQGEAAATALTTQAGWSKVIANKAIAASNLGVAATTKEVTFAILKLLGPIGILIGVAGALVTVFDLLIISEKEAKKNIDEANAAYDEQKNRLDELNNSLATTQDRLDQLNNQDSLTIVEEEELSKLKREQTYLERQIALQEELAKSAQKNQADTLVKNFNSSSKSLTSGPDLKRLGKTAEQWWSQQQSFYAKDSAQLAKKSQEYEAWLKDNEKLTTQWIADNREAIQAMEDNYTSLTNAIIDGYEIDPDQLKEIQNQLKIVRENLYGKTEYLELFIEPVIESDSADYIIDDIYNNLAAGHKDLAEGLITDSLKEELVLAGVSTEDFLNFIENKIDKTKNKISKVLTPEQINNLSAEDWNILSGLNKELLNSVKTADDLFNLINQNRKINFEVSGLDNLKSTFETISNTQEPLESAIDSYNDQGYLTAEEVYELIGANEEYAKYIIKVGDSYKLTNQAIADFNWSEDQQAQILDETLEAMKEKTSGTLEYMKTFSASLGGVSSKIQELTQKTTDWSKIGFKNQDQAEHFASLTTNLQNTIDKLAQGEISIEDYFNSVEDYIGGIGDAFSDLTDEIDDNIDELDLYEESFATITNSLADSLTYVNQQYQNGEIDMESYAKTTQKGLNNLIKLYSKQNKYIAQNQEGMWDYKITVDKATLSVKEQKRIEEDIAQLNTWQQALKDLYSYQEGIATTTKHAKYLAEYADSFGRLDNLDIEVTSNVDVLSQQFKDFSSDLNTVFTNLEARSDEAFNNVLTNLMNQGYEFKNGLATTAKELNAWTAGNAERTFAAEQALMDATEAEIQNSTQAMGQIIDALGSLIENFDYEITATVTDFSIGSLDVDESGSVILKGPSFTTEIVGSAKGDTASALEKLKSAGAWLRKNGGAAGGADSGRGGSIYDYLSPDENPYYEGKDLDGAATPKGKGGGGSSSKTAEDKSKEKERYHDINRQLEDQEQLLSEIEKQAERTYGLDRLKLYEKELEEINKQTAFEQIKMVQARTYLQSDTQALRDLNLNVQFKDNGEIANWNAIIDQTIAEYKAGIAGATEEEAKAVQEMYDKRIAAIEQYEESINTFQEQQEKVWDGLRKARDAELRNTTYKLDVLLTVKNMKDAAREFSQEVVESFSDKWYHGYASAELGAEGARAEMALLGEYQQQQADLQKLLDNADEFTNTEDIIAEMEELQGNVIASGEALLDWIETVETMLPEAIDSARERFSLFTDQLDHNTSVLDTIKELLSLQGVTYKTSRGFNTLQEVSQEKLDAAVASAELQKGWMERARTELLEAQRALEQVEEGDAAYDTLKNNRDALLEEYNSAQEAMLESAQEAMEVAREMFLTEIEKASYDFSKAISDGLGLDLLQERYDHLIEEEERYLDEVNTTYEQLKWNSKLQTAIDEASSLASKNSLKNLQEEFEQRKKNGEISQYDLDILNAKYEMTQKQIALEEAQNNKSQVRLVRNSQGNWDYQYTSDQSTIDNANQEYADAANEYYNIAKDQVKDVTEEIVATWQECNEKVKEIYEDETLTVAEREARIAEIREFYSEKILFLEEQKNNALKDMTAAGGEIIGEYGNTYQDVIDLMQDGTADFNEAFNEYLDDMEDAWNDYDDTVGDVADSTGTEMGDLKDIIDEVSESTDECREVGEELSEMMWDQMEDIRELSEDYADWADEIYGVVKALRDLAIAQGQAAEDASQESGANRDTTASSGRGYNASIDYASIIGAGVQNGWLSSGEVSKLESERDAKIEGEGLGDKYSSDVDWETIKVGSMTKEQWEKLLDKTVSLNTGGYTGDFSDSKLAFLHEKELVLNQTDTENILATVSMIRSIGPALLKQIETALDNNAIAGANLFNMKMGAAISADTTTQELLQTVHVTAEFPNATDQNEIREAILGLANYATQVVNPR